jgi:tetratricopeptide (TPR) repeat protein
LSQPSYVLLAFYLALSSAFSLTSCSDHPTSEATDKKPEIVASVPKEQALKLFDQAVEIALSLQDPVSRQKALVDIAKEMGMAGENTRALLILKRAAAEVTDNTETLSEIILQTAKLGHFDQAVETALSLEYPASRQKALMNIFKEMNMTGEKTRALSILRRAAAEVPNSAEALSEIALEAAKFGYQKQASYLFNKAIKLQGEPDKVNEEERYSQEESLVKIITKMAEARQFELASEATKKFSDKLSQAEALNEIVTKLISLGKLDEAQPYLLDALNIIEHISDNSTPYSYMSNGSCANYKSEVLSKIAQNLSLIGQLERALTTATKVYDCNSANLEQQTRYRVWAFSKILKPLKTPSQIKKAWQIAQTIGPDLDQGHVWGEVAIKLAEVHEADLAYEIAQKLTKVEFIDGLRDPTLPLLSDREELFQKIAMKLAKGGDLEKAQQLVKLLQPNYIELEAEAIAALEIAAGLDPKTQAASIQALRSQAVALTHRIIAQKDQNLASMDLSVEDRQLMFRGYLARSLTQQGQLDVALKLANMAQPLTNRERIIPEIAVVLAETGSIDRALTLVRTMGKHYGKDPALSRVNLLQKIIPRLQNRQQIEDVILMAPLTDSSISQEDRDLTFTALATRFVEVKEVSAGIRFTKKIRRDAVTAEIAKAVVKNGNFKEGIQLLALLTEKRAENAKAIAEIASVLIKAEKRMKSSTEL